MSSLLGTTLGGRYRLESRIGSGGMSTVYRAHDETLERWVAIKVMNREIAEDTDQLERFRREAKAVARLSHPNVVHVIDAGEGDGHPYIVFEYIDGETLKDRIRRLGRLEIPEAVAYAVEIGRALGAAHACRVVHRDVKPQNVLIDLEGTAKVTDFGIARTLEEDGLTDAGRVFGTTDYVSPEQALGKPATGQSDLYSLGIVLYEMLAGELPFKAESQVAVAMKHVREPLPDLRRLRPEVSATLAAVVETATAKELGQRYGDDTQLIAELENVLALETSRSGSADGEVTAELQTTVPEVLPRVPLSVRRRRALLSAVAVGIVAAVAAIVLLTLGSSPNRGGSHRRPLGRLEAVKLCSSCASAYNPDGIGGDTAQDNGQAHLAVDGDPNTGWSTQNYYSGQLGKPGVGIYVAAARDVAAREVAISTPTPGFSATVYGSRRRPDASSFSASGWVALASRANAGSTQTFRLAGDGTRSYRYFLVWITKLPPNKDYVVIDAIRLYRFGPQTS